MIGCADELELRTMTQMLAHRGPDDGGFWMSDDRSTGLGHRRLSIIDTSRAARQPMLSPDGRYVLVFNGEIFNHKELRAQLESVGYAFRTRSDAEVLLHAWCEWRRDVLTRVTGQFAFAVWDVNERRLFAARDHLGIKPFYYAADARGMWFASEAKAILAVRPDLRSIDPGAVPSYLTFLWVPGPATIFAGIKTLEPGSWLTWQDGTVVKGEYWDPLADRIDTAGADIAARAEEFRTRFECAVKSQLESDVPLGLLLSGGVDSTAILAAMSAAGKKVRAFTATYDSAVRKQDVFDDDVSYAIMAARKYGAELEQLEISGDLRQLLMKAIWHLDEPLADPTTITNLALTAAAKSHSTVLLSGMGADEILGGYPRHPAVLAGDRIGMVPAWVFGLASGVLKTALRARVLKIRQARRALMLCEHIHKPFRERFLGFSSYASRGDICSMLTQPFLEEAGEWNAMGPHMNLFNRYENNTNLVQMLAVDLRTFLPHLNLENMDKTSMASAVEIRVPFLDHTLVNFCLSLPDSDLVNGAERKVLLRRAYHDLPHEILHRPKTGYSPPVRGWVRNEFADDIRETLLSDRVSQRGIFNTGRIRVLIDRNARGLADHSMQLWMLYVLELWFRSFVDVRQPEPVLAPQDLEPVEHS
jgi:asparagine synthase (glutamine-hydrolysing)